VGLLKCWVTSCAYENYEGQEWLARERVNNLKIFVVVSYKDHPIKPVNNGIHRSNIGRSCHCPPPSSKNSLGIKFIFSSTTSVIVFCSTVVGQFLIFYMCVE
jgi:hypothetical protein